MTKAYDEVKSLVIQHKGVMRYQREGFCFGAWIVTLGDKSITIEASGEQSFPMLDQLYVPRIAKPKHWDDYFNELVPDAELKLLAMFGLSILPVDEIQGLRQAIERSKWKFAWTFARTYPHEYTTKTMSSIEDHSNLITCIEKYGVVESFGKYQNKYLYLDARKYWHMGEPTSDDPEKWPNVINRTWLEIAKHAENVKHVWTAEEVELQKRIWEIQLEKNKPK